MHRTPTGALSLFAHLHSSHSRLSLLRRSTGKSETIVQFHSRFAVRACECVSAARPPRRSLRCVSPMTFWVFNRRDSGQCSSGRRVAIEYFNQAIVNDVLPGTAPRSSDELMKRRRGAIPSDLQPPSAEQTQCVRIG